MKKENLDNIYKKGLEGAEIRPPEAVWDKISARLPEEKSAKPGIPLWYRLAGAAAGFLLLLGLGHIFLSPSPDATPSVTHEQLPTDSGTVPKASPSSVDRSAKEAVAVQENSAKSGADEENAPAKAAEGEIKISSAQTSTVPEDGTSADPFPKSPADQEQNPIATKKTDQESGQSKQEPGIPERAQSGDKGIPGTLLSGATALAQQEKPAGHTADEGLGEPGHPEEAASENPLLQEAREDQFFPKKAVVQQEEFSKAAARDSRFSLAPRVAPIYFESGSGALDPQFAQHKGAGELSFSYGVSMAYKISDKIKIRSGLNKLALAYNTRDVNFNAAVQSVAFGQPKMTATLAAPSTLASPIQGELSQEMGYLEVPLEVEYLLIDRQFGLSLVLGGSSLFLDQNSVSLEAGAFSSKLGEARNLNRTSFSTNVGLGLNYRITPRFRLNLEPTFKYQLNTFNNSSTNPYYFGLYTGFSYGF